MIAHFNAKEGLHETEQFREARDWSAFNRRWLAFLFSTTLVIYLVQARGTMLSIYQDFDVNLPALTSVALHWSTLVCLSLLPVAVLVKEFISLNSAQKRFFDSSTIALTMILGVIASWALFRPLWTLVQGFDG